MLVLLFEKFHSFHFDSKAFGCVKYLINKFTIERRKQILINILMNLITRQHTFYSIKLNINKVDEPIQ